MIIPAITQASGRFGLARLGSHECVFKYGRCHARRFLSLSSFLNFFFLGGENGRIHLSRFLQESLTEETRLHLPKLQIPSCGTAAALRAATE